MLVSVFVQELLSCCEELGPCLLLKDIGTPAERVCFDAEELLQTVEEYKRFIIKIEEG